MTHPFLSIIFPAHNEERRLPATLEKTATFLKTQPYEAEILVVENGSKDLTLQIAAEYARKIPFLKVIHEDARGKGLAVQRGMMEAQGEYMFFADVDLSMPIENVNLFIPPVLENVDIAIGSREAPGAVRYNEPLYRHWIGRIFNTMVKVLALPELNDTQCGFKCFRGEVAKDLFRYQTFGGMSFDVEILYIAKLRKYRMVEVPVPWYFNPDSRVKLFEDSGRMALDLLKIRKNARSGLYNPR